MGKVDWITYKTSIDEIIVPSEERAKVEEAYNNICGSFSFSPSSNLPNSLILS